MMNNTMKEVKYQVTLFCSTGQYKPVSCIITMKQDDETINLLDNKETKKDIVHKGIVKICQKRYWSNKDLIKYNYIKAKVRKVEKED